MYNIPLIYRVYFSRNKQKKQSGECFEQSHAPHRCSPLERQKTVRGCCHAEPKSRRREVQLQQEGPGRGADADSADELRRREGVAHRADDPQPRARAVADQPLRVAAVRETTTVHQPAAVDEPTAVGQTSLRIDGVAHVDRDLGGRLPHHDREPPQVDRHQVRLRIAAEDDLDQAHLPVDGRTSARDDPQQERAHDHDDVVRAAADELPETIDVQPAFTQTTHLLRQSPTHRWTGTTTDQCLHGLTSLCDTYGL